MAALKVYVLAFRASFARLDALSIRPAAQQRAACPLPFRHGGQKVRYDLGPGERLKRIAGATLFTNGSGQHHR
jgi:hypothetical protein